MTNNTPFKDLEIEFDDMLTNPEGFAKRVYEKTDELREICKADVSVASLTRQFEENKLPVDRVFHAIMRGFYDYTEEFPVEMMPSLIEMLKQEVKDLETSFQDRVIREASEQTDSMKDKKYAADLYRDVHKIFNAAVDFLNGFKGTNLKKLPALPGNYGSQTTGLKHYVYVYKGEKFRNPRALCRELGVEPISYYMDMIEFLEEHPEFEVEVKEVL